MSFQIILIAASSAALLGCLTQVVKYIRYTSYRRVDGIVVEAFIDEGKSRQGNVGYLCRLSYRYSVDGESFTGSTIYSLGRFGTGGGRIGKYIAKKLYSYKPGEILEVYANPTNPRDCFLRNGPVTQILALAFVSIVLIGLVFLFNLELN